MKRMYVQRHLLTIVGTLLAILMAGIPTGSVMAQSTTTYTSELTGAVVNTTGSWVIEPDSSDVGDGMEFVMVQGQTEFMQIVWLPGNVGLTDARDVLLDAYANEFGSFVTVDRGAYGNVSYSLDITTAEGIDFGVFTLFLGQRQSGFVEAYAFFGPVMLFAQGISSAQANVSISGEPVLQGIDGAGLQSFLQQKAGASDVGNTGDQPQPTATTAPVEPTPTDVPVTDEGGDAYVESLRGEIEYLQGTLDNFIVNFAGIQGENSDQAVQEINRISQEWLDYATRADSIVAPAGYEQVDAAYRTLVTDVQTLGTDWRNTVSVIQAKGDTDQAIQTFVASLNVVQTDLDDLGALLDQQASSDDVAVETETPVATEPQPTATEVAAPEPTATTSTSTKGKTKGPVLVNGNESETGTGGQGTQTASSETETNADLGLLSDGDYVSPQTGVEITWDASWYFDDTYTEPIKSDTSSGIDTVTISSSTDSTTSIFVSVASAGGTTPADLADLWTSADYLAENAAPNAEVLADETGRSGSTSVLMRDYLDNGTEVIIMRSAACADDPCATLVVTTMIGLPDSFADAYRDARNGIDVDGARLYDALTPRAVSTALGQ